MGLVPGGVGEGVFDLEASGLGILPIPRLPLLLPRYLPLPLVTFILALYLSPTKHTIRHIMIHAAKPTAVTKVPIKARPCRADLEF